jgi:hypothetical protein
MNSMTTKLPPLPGSEGKLNVILHGLYAFAEDLQARWITAYIPNMGTDHVYKAGTWFGETDLAEHADLRLGGVREEEEPGTETIKAKVNLVVQGPSVYRRPHESDMAYATLRLPFPREPIRSLRTLTLPQNSVGGPSIGQMIDFSEEREKPTATVQVLTYNFESDAQLQLGNHPWQPALEGDYVNLHVFSEPERSIGEDHVRHAFQAMMSLLGAKLSLNRPADDYDISKLPDREIPEGVDRIELQTLLERQRWLMALGRGIKEGRDVNGIWKEPIPFGGGGICVDGGTCQC